MHKMVPRTFSTKQQSLSAKMPVTTGKTRKVPKKAPMIDPRYSAFKLEMRPSKIHRWGVYAGEDIPVRRKVMEYTGERISRKETRRRREERGGRIYLFTWDST